MPELRDLADNIVRPGDLIATSLAQRATLQVGEVVDILWKTEPFKCWNRTVHASAEKPFPQMRVLYPSNTRTTLVHGVSANFIKVVKD